MRTARRVPLARRNLFQERRRALLAVAGVAMALLLVLALQGIFDGAMRQVTAYIRTSEADLFVSQQSVRTMHMSASALPPGIVGRLRAERDVAWAAPIRFAPNAFLASDKGRELSYVIGYDAASGRGGPGRLSSGRPPAAGEAVLDRVAADRLGVGLSDRIRLLGASFAISGLSSGGTSIVNTTAFIRGEDFARLRGPAVGYVLVGGRAGVRPGELARRLQAALPEVTVQTRTELARQEAGIVQDMSADVMRIMSAIGFLIALAVVALTLFTATLAKLREYAVAKAIGARSAWLIRTVLVQAAWAVGVALLVAVGLAVAVATAVGAATPSIRLAIEPASVVRTAIGALLVGGIGSVLPLRRVTKVDPASVFRRA
jgi:putative ABC transport system permease protein